MPDLAPRRGAPRALALLAASLLAGGCMGTPTREVLLPKALKGARVTADGDDAYELKQGVSAVVPLTAGVQVVRVEAAGRAALVERMNIVVNDPKAVAEGVNVLVARIDEGLTHRTIIAFPEEPLMHLGHDFEPPAASEGLILLASRVDASATVDGRALPPFQARKGMLYQAFVTRPLFVRVAPGKHRVVFAAPGAPEAAAEVELEAGTYEVLGASLRRKEKAADPGTAVDLTK
jgi:hypothetical protein